MVENKKFLNTEYINAPKENEENEDDLAELPPLLRDLFDWLLDHHEVESSGARWKVCLLVNRLLKLLGEEAEIDDELYQKIYVRTHHMLSRILNPRNPNIFHEICRLH